MVTPETLLQLVREFNSDLPHHSMKDSEGIPSSWLDAHLMPLAVEMYQREPHWHSVGGKCMEDVPFEIRMLALALLTCGWVTDIFLRKSRDRQSRGMYQRWESWRDLVEKTTNYIDLEIRSHRNLEAEKAYQTEAKRPNLFQCWLNRHRWGH